MIKHAKFGSSGTSVQRSWTNPMQQAMQTVRQTFGRVCVHEGLGLSEEIVSVHQL